MIATDQPFDRSAWLAARRYAIGASDVPAILGVSPFASEWDIWADKTSRVSEWGGNAATRLGQHFEKAVLDVAEERLGQLRRNIRIAHNTLPVAATLDAQCITSLRPVEAKTTGLAGAVYGDWGDEGTDAIPQYYLVQVHTQLLCTAADMAYLFALIPGRGVVQYEIQRSDKVCEQLGSLLAAWWQKHVIEDVEPSREKASFEVVKRMRRSEGKEADVSEAIEKCVDRLEKAKRVIKRATQIKEKYESQVLAALGEAEVGNMPSGRSYSYFEQTRSGHYVEESKFRVLRVRKAKK